MRIETNMPEEFGNELKALLEKYGISSANGWGDGGLVLYRKDGASSGYSSLGAPLNFWVYFHDDEKNDF